MRIRKEEIAGYLRQLAEDLESGELISDYALIEEWYNCDAISGDRRLSIIYGRKKNAK
jgi:hypothetical protein